MDLRPFHHSFASNWMIFFVKCLIKIMITNNDDDDDDGGGGGGDDDDDNNDTSFNNKN